MAANPSAPEFYSTNMVLPPPYCSYSATFISPGFCIPLHRFTGFTICCATPPPLTFNFHSNSDFYLFGPAWFLPLVFSTSNIMQAQEVVVEDETMPRAAAAAAAGGGGGGGGGGSSGMMNKKRMDASQNRCHLRFDEKKKNNNMCWKPKSSVNLKRQDEEKTPCSVVPPNSKLGHKGAKMMNPIQRESSMTTVMVKNIPNRYTVGMLLDLLDQHCREENQKIHDDDDYEDYHPSEFDFFYLPMDFKSDCNKGYAFVNFTHPSAVWRLHLSWSGTSWTMFKSSKICELTYAAKQGKKELLMHFEASEFACEPQEYLPTYFEPPRDGSGKPVQQKTVGKRVHKIPPTSL